MPVYRGYKLMAENRVTLKEFIDKELRRAREAKGLSRAKVALP